MGEVKKCERLGCEQEVENERGNYCSPECKQWMKNYRRSMATQERKAGIYKVPDPKKCAYAPCEVVFTPDVHRPDQQYHSHACAKRDWDEKRKKAKEKLQVALHDVAPMPAAKPRKRPHWMSKVLEIHRPELLEKSHE